MNARADGANVTLAILAGGEGSRMGIAKGRIELDGRPILEFLLDQLSWNGPTLLVTAPGREHPPGWQRFGREVSDPQAGGGPLRGIHTALENIVTPFLMVVPVDMPGIDPRQCRAVLEALECDPCLLGVMTRRRLDGQRPHIEPFPLALRRESLPIIARRLSERRRAVHGLLDEGAFIAIDADPADGDRAWANLNVPADVESFKKT